jgi:hypothetical protein
MSRSGIFVLIDDRQTKPIALPLAHARGVKILVDGHQYLGTPVLVFC